MLRGILSLSLAKSQVGSAPPQNLAEEGTVWKHWRRPLEGMGRRGVLPSDGHGRPFIHRGRACTGWGRPAILGGAGLLLLSSSLQVVTGRPYPICRCRVCLRTNRTNTDMPPTSSAGLQSRVLASVLMSTTGPLPPHSCHDIGHWTRTRSSVAATQNHLFATSLELSPETPTGITQSSIRCQSPHGGSWSLHNHPLP